jgi:hypothetical protein
MPIFEGDIDDGKPNRNAGREVWEKMADPSILLLNELSNLLLIIL